MKRRKRREMPSPRIVRGGTNVFADLGFARREAAELQVKAELARQIYNRIKTLGLTQVQAASRLGLSQPDVSKLMNARFSGYSTDRLFAILSALEVDVEIILRPRKAISGRAVGDVRVREAAAA